MRTLLFKKDIKLVSLVVWTAHSAVMYCDSQLYCEATLCCNALYNVLYCTDSTLVRCRSSPGNCAPRVAALAVV